jgi:enoyl-CoA hydratase/carnithine racemase
MEQGAIVSDEEPQPGVCLLRLNRPEALNALNGEMIDRLVETFDSVAARPDVRAVVLTGAGRGFCSGLDLRWEGPHTEPSPRDVTSLLDFQQRLTSLVTRLRALPQPVIAAVNGPAFGGGMALALGADIRVCARSASFAVASVKVGLTAGEMGTTYLLPRIVGAGIASDWALTGRTIAADEALRTGLVSCVAEDTPELLDHALGLAAKITACSPEGMRASKTLLHLNTDAAGEDAALDLEIRAQVQALLGENLDEAREAFAQGRPPRFER